MQPKTLLYDWIDFTRSWLDEQQRIQDEQDAAAYARFRAALLPFD